jgi:integrase
VRYLRTLEVSPNGHPNSPKRPLLDKGIKYILQCCRSLFHFAIKHRYLSPYADNPFSALDLERIPVENAKQVILFSVEQERNFLEACDAWQLPLFATLVMTGMRPGELTHLLLPDDLDLDAGILHVRNKPELGWQVKTRNEREIPLVPPLVELFKLKLANRKSGVLFQRRRFAEDGTASPQLQTIRQMQTEIAARIASVEAENGRIVSREEKSRIARSVWRDAGLIKTEQVRKEFMRLTSQIGLPNLTTPKMLRHLFATTLQEGNVDPLIRCELMGHSTASSQNAPHGLGMTANYTQTRTETKRWQLENAMKCKPSWQMAYIRISHKGLD